MLRYVTMKHGLKLEIAGLRISRGRTCYAMAKSELGFRGNRAKVLAQLEEWIVDPARPWHSSNQEGA